MNETNKVAIIIPFYQATLSGFEKMALAQCEKVLPNYPKIAIKPKHLTLPVELNNYNFIDVISFDDKYFDDIQGYNELMLSEVFYSAFLKYNYILIHQLDAFVFKNDLTYWCNQDYDYLGAPWLRKKDYPHFLKAFVTKSLIYLYTRFNITKHGVPSKKQFDNKVGNGGFSLRRVSKFNSLCLSMRPQIQLYLKKNEHQFHEDAFWSVEVNRKKRTLNIPDYKIGLKFSFELAPERALKLNSNQLPFGCHAWDKHIDFWRPIFKKMGYDI
jgi:hypothetical protein